MELKLVLFHDVKKPVHMSACPTKYTCQISC